MIDARNHLTSNNTPNSRISRPCPLFHYAYRQSNQVQLRRVGVFPSLGPACYVREIWVLLVCQTVLAFHV